MPGKRLSSSKYYLWPSEGKHEAVPTLTRHQTKNTEPSSGDPTRPPCSPSGSIMELKIPESPALFAQSMLVKPQIPLMAVQRKRRGDTGPKMGLGGAFRSKGGARRGAVVIEAELPTDLWKRPAAVGVRKRRRCSPPRRRHRGPRGSRQGPEIVRTPGAHGSSTESFTAASWRCRSSICWSRAACLSSAAAAKSSGDPAARTSG